MRKQGFNMQQILVLALVRKQGFNKQQNEKLQINQSVALRMYMKSASHDIELIENIL